MNKWDWFFGTMLALYWLPAPFSPVWRRLSFRALREYGVPMMIGAMWALDESVLAVVWWVTNGIGYLWLHSCYDDEYNRRDWYGWICAWLWRRVRSLAFWQRPAPEQAFDAGPYRTEPEARTARGSK